MDKPSEMKFPASTVEEFPRGLWPFLIQAVENEVYAFPNPLQVNTGFQPEYTARRNRTTHFSWLVYWYAAMHTFYVSAAWANIVEDLEDGLDEMVCEKSLVATLNAIDKIYRDALKEVFIHYGHDYEGASPARVE